MVKKVILVAVLALASGLVRAEVIPAGGDLWTESSAYASCWSSGRGGPLSYVTDALVGSYSVEDSKSVGYFCGDTFVIPDGSIDLSMPLAKIGFAMKVNMTNDVTDIPIEIRAYTDSTYDNYFFATGTVTKNQWSVCDDMLVTNLSRISGSADWSHVYAFGFYATYPYADATTVQIDGLHVVTPEPVTASMLLLGGSVLATIRRSRKA